MSVDVMVTALFPIRGQPPHIGHILTLVRIYDEYDKILVRIIATPGKYYGSKDFVLPPEKVASIFCEIFKHMPKIEVIVSKEHLRDMKSIDGSPPFDVIVSGNKRFLEGVKHLKPVRYVPRSQINGFNISGEILRELMRSNKNQQYSLKNNPTETYDDYKKRFHETEQDLNRVGFHILHNFHHAMLDPIYSLLKDEFKCLMTNSIEEIISFNPRILILADRHYDAFREDLPNTIIVWTRHGFISKNESKKAVSGCDFACVSSEWVRDDLIKRGSIPRLGFWLTGFVPMDQIFQNKNKSALKALPNDFSKGKNTLIYAPTHDKLLNSVEILGDRWVDHIRQTFPNLNIIIKPHPVILERNPEWMKMWQESVRRNNQTLLVEDTHSSIYDYFPFADILLSDASSVIFYFLALDRPIILVNNPHRYEEPNHFDPEGPEWNWRDVGIEINKIDELPSAIMRSMENPDQKSKLRKHYRNMIFGNILDGRAAERIAERVREVLYPERTQS